MIFVVGSGDLGGRISGLLRQSGYTFQAIDEINASHDNLQSSIYFFCISGSRNNIETASADISNYISRLGDSHLHFIFSTISPDFRADCRHKNSWVFVPIFSNSNSENVLGTGGNIHYYTESARVGEIEDLLTRLDPSVAAISRSRSFEDLALAKICNNAYLALRVSFINEIDEICRTKNIDFDSVISILRNDSRFGKEYSDKSAGFGGHCMISSTAHLESLTESLDSTPLIRNLSASNRLRMQSVVQSICDKTDVGDVIAIAGVGYKSDSDRKDFSVGASMVDMLMSSGRQVTEIYLSDSESAVRAKLEATSAQVIMFKTFESVVDLVDESACRRKCVVRVY